MTSHRQSETGNDRVTRSVTVLCFILAGVLLIMSLVQSSKARAGQSHYAIQLPESRVLSVNKRPQHSMIASIEAFLYGAAMH